MCPEIERLANSPRWTDRGYFKINEQTHQGFGPRPNSIGEMP